MMNPIHRLSTRFNFREEKLFQLLSGWAIVPEPDSNRVPYKDRPAAHQAAWPA